LAVYEQTERAPELSVVSAMLIAFNSTRELPKSGGGGIGVPPRTETKKKKKREKRGEKKDTI
jgi:hypothetical protein